MLMTILIIVLNVIKIFQAFLTIVPQVIKMFLAIIGVFFICCGPKWVMNIMKRHNLGILHTDAAFNIMV